jgi:hypothetical protein
MLSHWSQVRPVSSLSPHSQSWLSAYLTFYAVYIFFGKDLIPPFIFVHLVTGFIVVEYFHFVVTACIHIARTLNIRVFHVFDPKNLKK